MTALLKDEVMARYMLILKTVFDVRVVLSPDRILTIRPDKKYPNICHIGTNMKDKSNRPLWFHVKHSDKEVLNMYYKIKHGKGD